MGLSNHHRALVSNLGEGNWTGDDKKLDSGDTRIYFPPGASKGVAPVPGTSNAGPMSDFDLAGWGTKSNWIIQLDCINKGTKSASDNDIEVFAIRPTGVKELVFSLANNVLATGEQYAHGGLDSEKICGPVSYFEFITNSSGAIDVDCYVIGWNEGDMAYGLAG
tara:strand:- start:10102 stop:10593 length:492 start_codon:yes stop_codon:yes gene_type:complete